MNRLKFLFWTVLMGTAWLIVACSGVPDDEPGPNAITAQQPVSVAVPVRVNSVELGEISSILKYSGNLNPRADVEVNPRVSGDITAILVNVGDEVKQGDPIALIDDEFLLIDVENAEVSLKAAVAALSTAEEVVRAAQLSKEGAELELVRLEAGSRDEDIIAARAGVDQAAAQLTDVELIDDSERTQAVLNLAKAEAARKKAQFDYDKIAWAGSVGGTPQAAALEQATADYEAALAQYELQTNPRDQDVAPLRNQLAQAEQRLAIALTPYRDFEFDIVHNKIDQADNQIVQAQAQMAQAQTQIEQAKVAVKKAELQLSHATVRAAFDGFIAEVPADVGDLASSSTTVVRIISNDLELKVNVEENRYGLLAEALPATLNVSAYPGVNFPAVVSNVPPVANGTTHTFEVTIIPQDERGLLRGGMFADVNILAETRENVPLLPRSAVTQREGKPVVFVVSVDEDLRKVEQRNVTTGLQNRDFIEILSGVESGEVVVVSGQANLVDGTPVTVVNDEE